MKKNNLERPTVEQLEIELKRVQHSSRFRTVIKSTVYTLIAVAAIAVLVATLWLPVLEIYGTSMIPTFEPGQIVVSAKTNNLSSGDIVAFYYNNKILVKRYIAGPGQWVNIDRQGVVSVDGVPIEEPYLDQPHYGDNTDIDFPYQVPDGRIFVMGDSRQTSMDSRSMAVGCVSQEELVGRILLRVWPLNEIETF